MSLSLNPRESHSGAGRACAQPGHRCGLWCWLRSRSVPPGSCSPSRPRPSSRAPTARRGARWGSGTAARLGRTLKTGTLWRGQSFRSGSAPAPLLAMQRLSPGLTAMIISTLPGQLSRKSCQNPRRMETPSTPSKKENKVWRCLGEDLDQRAVALHLFLVVFAGQPLHPRRRPSPHQLKLLVE